jgi:hypothetical protein
VGGKGLFMKIAVLMICIFALAAPANAQEGKGTTAREMYESCNSDPQSGEMLLCQGYMAGYAQGAFGFQSMEGSKKVCLPAYFAGTELLAIFKRRMKSFAPESKSWSLSVGPVLYFILTEQFPCKKP